MYLYKFVRQEIPRDCISLHELEKSKVCCTANVAIGILKPGYSSFFVYLYYSSCCGDGNMKGTLLKEPGHSNLPKPFSFLDSLLSGQNIYVSTEQLLEIKYKTASIIITILIDRTIATIHMLLLAFGFSAAVSA